MIAFDVRRYGSIGSTNDEALRLAREGSAHGTVVCAREQTAGRGRQARSWHSPGGNLHASVLLRPDAPSGRLAELSFVAALAAADTVDQFLPDGVTAELKWPNDVLVRGGKIAGILLETADAAVVVGIGINVQHTPTGAPYPVTSLAALGAVAPVVETILYTLLQRFGRRLDDWQDQGFADIRSGWLERAHPPGSPIRVSIGERTIIGRFADLAHDGALIVESEEGTLRIVAGDVTIMPSPAATH